MSPIRSRGSSVTSRLLRLTALPASPSVKLSCYKWLSLCLPYRNSLSYLGQHERKQAPLAMRFSTARHAEMSVIQSDCCPLHPELKLACLRHTFCLPVLLIPEDVSPTRFSFTVPCPYLKPTQLVRRYPESCYKVNENDFI